jgi:glucose-1-phosphate adenylyltransferase
MKTVLAMVLAGGKGERLLPLTRDRAKPAVPFGGVYRIIDFTLSNCVNSNMRRVILLTQYKSLSLDRHVREGWSLLSRWLNEYIDQLPPQHRLGEEEWYRGTADAILQNVYSIEQENPEYVLILAGDHIYKMNYAHMVNFHRRKRADLTIAAVPVGKGEGQNFGIMAVDADNRLVNFEEKPRQPETIPGDPTHSLASMGIYVFSREVLLERLYADSRDPSSSHDFGRDIVPQMFQGHRVYAYHFVDENRKEALYWRDVGTLDSYWRANMDLVAVDPIFNLYDRNWPIRTFQPQYPPAKFVFADDGHGARRGEAHDSIVAQGCIISGGRLLRCVVSPDVFIHSYAHLEDSVLFEGVDVGRHCRIRRAIVDKDVTIPPNTIIGYDLERDRERFHVTENGVVVISKGAVVPEMQEAELVH